MVMQNDGKYNEKYQQKPYKTNLYCFSTCSWQICFWYYYLRIHVYILFQAWSAIALSLSLSLSVFYIFYLYYMNCKWKLLYEFRISRIWMRSYIISSSSTLLLFKICGWICQKVEKLNFRGFTTHHHIIVYIHCTGHIHNMRERMKTPYAKRSKRKVSSTSSSLSCVFRFALFCTKVAINKMTKDSPAIL